MGGDSPSSPRVAIIGAGFCGLVCARALQRAGVRATVYEKLPAIDATTVCGNFRLPSASGVLHDLGLVAAHEALRDRRRAAGVSDQAYLPQQPLLLALAASLRPGALVLGRAVERVTRDADGRHCCHLCGKEDPEGPYKVVVLANGLYPLRSLSVDESGDVAVAGDARWAQRRWWDFGSGRIDRGADTALRDGIELARIIRSKLLGRGGASMAQRLGKFAAFEKGGVLRGASLVRSGRLTIFAVSVVALVWRMLCFGQCG